MKTFYYIAYSKRRGRFTNHGDGLLDAETVKEVRETIARAKGIARSHIVVKPYVKTP